MNRKTMPVFVVLLAVGVFLGQWVRRGPEPWIPVLEPTGFEYLEASTSRTLGEVLAAHRHLTRGDASGATESLERAVDVLVKLDRYFVPLTEVREFVYDADRLFHLGEVAAAKRSLERGKDRLLQVASVQKPNFPNSAEEVVLEVDELLLALGANRPEATALFEEVGHRINLMALKGDLILANVHFGVEDAKQ